MLASIRGVNSCISLKKLNLSGLGASLSLFFSLSIFFFFFDILIHLNSLAGSAIHDLDLGNLLTELEELDVSGVSMHQLFLSFQP